MGRRLQLELDGGDDGLDKAVCGLFDACKEIAYKIRTASCDSAMCFNDFGDEQLAIDVLANNVIFQQLRECGVVGVASSEEEPTEQTQGGEGFAVAFDPLDGSSIIDSNFAVGTKFGIWPGATLRGVTGSEMVAAGMCTYGPRTTITLAVDGVDGAHEFLLVDDFSARHGKWIKCNSFYTVGEGKLFAPGNLRATKDNEGYAALMQYWLENQYQLRYTGGMVTDVNQILVKGRGIFVNPASAGSKAKLRLLYEVAPLAYIMEKGGGRSSNGRGSILDVPVPDTEARTQVALGSAAEVCRFEEMVGAADDPSNMAEGLPVLDGDAISDVL